MCAGQYDQNKCSSNDPSCVPCKERLPSCEGLPDGYNIFPTREYTRWYIKCSQNRTIEVTQCPPNTIFDVKKNICTSSVIGSMSFLTKWIFLVKVFDSELSIIFEYLFSSPEPKVQVSSSDHLLATPGVESIP